MVRKVFLNDVPCVNLYASEAGPNTGNCASGCSGNCGNGGNDSGSVTAIVGSVITATAIILTADPNPPETI